MAILSVFLEEEKRPWVNGRISGLEVSLIHLFQKRKRSILRKYHEIVPFLYYN